MKKRRQRSILSFLLALAMVVGMLPVSGVTAWAYPMDVSADGNIIKIELSDWVNYYTGEEVKPEVTVTVNGALLQQDVDYTVSYSDNVGGDGIVTEENAKVNIDGKGNYVFLHKSVYFRIMPQIVSGNGIVNMGDGKGTCLWRLDEEGTLTLFNPNFSEGNYVSFQSKGYVRDDNGAEMVQNDFDRWKDSIRKVVFDGDFQGVGEGCFDYFDNLCEVELNDGIQVIGQRAFHECDNLQKINIPETVKEIQYLAFAYCRKLSVELPDAIASIHNGAFNYSTNQAPQALIARGTISENGVTVLTQTEEALKASGSQFSYADEPDFRLMYQNDGALGLVEYLGNGGDVVIPDSVTCLPNSDVIAYSEGNAITGLVIPGSVSRMNVDALRNFSNLTTVRIEPGALQTISGNFLSGCDNYTLFIPRNVEGINDINGDNHVLVVDEDSYAHSWALDHEYTPDDFCGEGHHYRLNTTVEPTIDPADAGTMEVGSLSDITVTTTNGRFGEDPGYYRLLGLMNGDLELVDGTDYTVSDETISGNTVTIKKEYLAKLGEGNHRITFRFAGSGDTIFDEYMVADEDLPLTIKIYKKAAPAPTPDQNQNQNQNTNNNKTVDPDAGKEKEPVVEPVVEHEMTLNDDELVIKKGKTSKAIKVTLKNDTIKSVKSSNKKVATASFKGKTISVKGVKAGKATIKVTSESGITATLKITVQNGKVTTKKITLSTKKITLKKGNQTKVEVKAIPDQLSTGQQIKVKSSNKKIANVKYNKKTGEIIITAKGKGTAKVTVTAGKKKEILTVKVKK